MSDPDAAPIPDDFPRFTGTGALEGAQPKVALLQVEGRFTSLGPDLKTLVQLHAMCESLAREIAGSGKQLVESAQPMPRDL